MPKPKDDRGNVRIDVKGNVNFPERRIEAQIAEGMRLPIRVNIPFAAVKQWASAILAGEVQMELGAGGGGGRIIPAQGKLPPDNREV